MAKIRVRRSDQILVVEAGRIVERGTHTQLLAHEGRYHHLYTRQHGLEENLFLAPGEGDRRQPSAAEASPVLRIYRSSRYGALSKGERRDGPPALLCGYNLSGVGRVVICGYSDS